MKKDLLFPIGVAISVLIFLAGFVVGQQILKRGIWTGFYYPDKTKIEDVRTWLTSPPLYSLNECRDWANSVRKSGDNYDYQCGQECIFTTKYGETSICKSDSR